jgi:hypothetical protein
MANIMNEMVEKLLQSIGLERGRIWASGDADYFEIREWCEVELDSFDDLVLPPREDMHFKVLSAEAELEWKPYLKGWVDGVKEIAETY